jgi:glycosyltransferase involved in cell wall biosynthesis
MISVHHNCIACLKKNYRSIVRGNLGKRFYFKFLDNKLGWLVLETYNDLKYKHLFKSAIHRSDAFLLYFESFRDELGVLINGFRKDKVLTIPNPAPFKVTNRNPSKENRLLFVGRLNVQQKRADLLVRLWEKLVYEFPNWHFDILGDGPYRETLENEIKKRKLPRITVHGFKDPEPFYERAKIFCMTSAFEGYGMVLAEAQSYGTVPLAFNTFSAVTDMIEHKRGGFIIAPFDIDTYAVQLIELMTDEALLNTMADYCKMHIAKFELSVIVNKWYALFDSLMLSTQHD